MPVKPALARHKTEDLGDGLFISIPSRKQWLQIILLSFWLAAWAFGEIGVSWVLIRGEAFGPTLFMIVWLVMWTFAGFYAIYMWAWQLFGEEVIEVTGQSIIISRVVLGFSIPKEYSAEYIKELRISTVFNGNDLFGWSRTMGYWGMGAGLIAFDYGAQTIRFGGGIDEAEAKQIMVEIQQRYPQYCSRSNSA